MAGLRDRSTVDMESERRTFGLSSTMPNLEYSTSYSGALSDAPASHHALSTAYDDLKKRYNDLQGKYTQTAKQLREAHRRGSSPDISTLTPASPRHMTSSRSPGRAVDLENGDITPSDWNLVLKERDLLERHVSELEHKLSESANQQAECEHESKQLREHVSRQEEDLRHSQQLLLRSENENEEIRKQMTLVKRQLKQGDTERDRERMRDLRSLSPAAGAAYGQNSLNSSLDSSTLGRSSLSAAGSLEHEELASIVQTTVNVTHQMKELLSVVNKQRDVIKMLYKRLHDEREMFHRQLEAQRQNSESAPCGIGARPKIRTPVGATAHGAAAVGPGCPQALPPSGRSQIVNAVPCSEDVTRGNPAMFRPPRQRETGKIGQHDLHSPVESGGLMRSPERGLRSRIVTERHSAPAAAPIGGGRHPLPPSESPPMDHELESHYDDLTIGGGVDVPWERRHHEEDNKSETEPLLPSPRRLGRNESMEHLHDDSPPLTSLGDLGDSTSGSGSTLRGTDPESDYDLPDHSPRASSVGYQEMKDDDNASSTGEPDHGRREASSPRPYHHHHHPRPPHNYGDLGGGGVDVETLPAVINADNDANMNQHSSAGMPRMWAPATSNNTQASSTQSSTSAMATGAGTTVAPTNPVAPPRRQYTRVAVERGSGEEDTRNCPVCTDDFPSHMAMEEFQKHVLECPGRPERICPMCDTSFPDEVSQSEFERHVNEHFEDDVTIQNYEILQS